MKRIAILIMLLLISMPSIVHAQTLELKSVETLLAHSDKKPVVLVYWATWCDTCMEDLSELEAFYDSRGNRVHVYSVNATKSERSSEQVKHFAEKSDLHVPVYLDKKGEVATHFRQVAVPFTVIVKNGKRQVIPGPVTKEQLEKWTD
ncbi:TlpA family protein disulfide reductase [Terribacillus aidingensis]|uniref:TlpA family protein disulfide reductase n=1 Tax=Terribacillus aidingensis TaxID=586416 RepID=UPI0015CB26F5|nr:TlpA disulfide reductase family protein [Terribacillus aidingensis]